MNELQIDEWCLDAIVEYVDVVEATRRDSVWSMDVAGWELWGVGSRWVGCGVVG